METQRVLVEEKLMAHVLMRMRIRAQITSSKELVV